MLLAAGAAPSCAGADSLDPDLEQARKMIAEGKPAQASALLAPYELNEAGNTQFDYLLGLALLNDGQADRASIVLERVLMVDPLYAAAWVDLGRAYYLLGDFARARESFAKALELNPPVAAQATIAQYLKEIGAQKKPLTQFSGYVEMGGGYNNNVNNATSQSQILVPVLVNAPLPLSPSNIKTADNYLSLATGGEVMRPLSSGWSLYAGADVRSRSDAKSKDFDFIGINARAGAYYTKDADQVRVGMLAEQFDLGASVNHRSGGLNAEWDHALGNANQATLFGQQIRYRYPDPLLSSSDFDQTLGGAAVTHLVAGGKALISGSLFAGSERDTNMRIDGGKSMRGLRLSGQWQIRDRLNAFVYGGVMHGKYDRMNTAFLVFRDDRQTDLSIGLNYDYAQNWSLRPQLGLIRNRSNIVVEDFEQADLSLTLRRNFK
jgi:hypothetical protein